MSARITTIPTLFATMKVCTEPCRWCGSIAECEHDVCCAECERADTLCDLDCQCHGPKPGEPS